MKYKDNIFTKQELLEIDSYLQNKKEFTVKFDGKYKGISFLCNSKDFQWATEKVYNKFKDIVPGKFLGISTWKIKRAYHFHVDNFYIDNKNQKQYNIKGTITLIIIPLSTDNDLDKVSLAGTLFKIDDNNIARIDWKQGRIIYFDSKQLHASAPFENYQTKEYLLAQVAQLD